MLNGGTEFVLMKTPSPSATVPDLLNNLNVGARYWFVLAVFYLNLKLLFEQRNAAKKRVKGNNKSSLGYNFVGLSGQNTNDFYIAKKEHNINFLLNIVGVCIYLTF
jgi:hypothetical protein